MQFNLPALPYDESALGPHISATIMSLHHDKHHQAYVDKLNGALQGLATDFFESTLHTHLAGAESGLPGDRTNTGVGTLELAYAEALLKNIAALPVDIRTTVQNNGGGHYNHSLFWQWLSPRGGGQPTGWLADNLTQKYGSFQQFVDEFSQHALGVFGSGWVWLQPNLDIIITPNQDSPLMAGLPAPLLGLDVWEHAYYLDYKNNRADYIKAWWDVVNWQFVQERLARANI